MLSFMEAFLLGSVVFSIMSHFVTTKALNLGHIKTFTFKVTFVLAFLEVLLSFSNVVAVCSL